MKIVLASNLVPFIRGGAEAHVHGLYQALVARGHDVELLRLPFVFSPEADIERLMAYTETLDLTAPNGQNVDRVISLQFPAFGVRHPRHIVWLMHQHRGVYELYDPEQATPEQARLRELVHDYDRRTLGRAHRRFANSARVAERLRQYNGLDAEPLYHPPPDAEQFYCSRPEPYIYCPSRLERLKRQDLLIRAAAHMRSPLKLLISGDGGQSAYYQALIDELGVGDRVRLLGRVDARMKIALYARSTAVFFAPFDEDMGYVTLEAMLASKPVVTCTDSGGPLAFVQDGETGFVAPPDPERIAERLDWLHGNVAQARAMGEAGRQAWQARDITWARVVDTLLHA